MAAPLQSTTQDTRRCGVHHRPLAACEIAATPCPDGGLIRQYLNGEPDYTACLCRVCTEQAS